MALGDGPPRPSYPWRWLALAAVVLAASVAVVALPQREGTGAVALGGVRGGGPLAAGSPAPDFELAGPGGGVFRLGDYRGQPVLLNFWATWCPPCRSEMPDIEALYREAPRRFAVLAVNIQEAEGPVRQFVSKYGLTFPVVLDTTGEVTQRYGVSALPTTYFIDADGTVAEAHVGPLNRASIEERLRRLGGGG